MKYIMIDCDPGHDDALAILTAYAHPEELRILGVTTIGGNQTLEKVTENARRILQFLHADIPLASGQAGPLVKPLHTAEDAHGESGMDGPVFEKADYPLVSDNAVVFLKEQIMACPEKVTIVAIGPLTNIALLMKVYPETKEKIERISIMGGGISHGNSTELAEFNIYVDPEAAHIVFHAGVPIVMAGLDVTEKALITVREIESLKDKGRVSRMAGELLGFYNESGRQYGFTDSPIHDLCAVAYLLQPDLFQGEYQAVDVITEEGCARGLTFADKRLMCDKVKNVFVLEEVDRDRVAAMLIEALERLDESIS